MVIVIVIRAASRAWARSDPYCAAYQSSVLSGRESPRWAACPMPVPGPQRPDQQTRKNIIDVGFQRENIEPR